MDQLLPFLRDKQPNVRHLALENLLPACVPDHPQRKLFTTAVVSDLALLCRDQLMVAHDAFRALVNLSDQAHVVSVLAQDANLSFLVGYAVHPDATCADLAAMILSNISSSASSASKLLTLKIPTVDGVPTNARSATTPNPPSGQSTDTLALPLLFDAFVDGSKSRKAKLHFLASLFANLSSTTTGRAFFLTPRNGEYPLASILAFTEHPDPIRRAGVVNTIKNCCFNPPAHKAILSSPSDSVSIPPSTESASGMDALPYLLLPLAGPEPLDDPDLPDDLQMLPETKKRESDWKIRLTIVEALLLLCHTRWGRDFMRGKGVYEVIRVAHENEIVDKVSEHMERLVQLIKGDEPEHLLDEDEVGGPKVDEDSDDDKLVEV